LEDWIGQQGGQLSWQKPAATSIAFVRYHMDMPSVELAGHLRDKVSVLVAPGSTLGTEYHLRMAVGYEGDKLKTALGRIGEAVLSLSRAKREIPIAARR
jgi:aspartate/methionine/tyrosine aminotransferase